MHADRAIFAIVLGVTLLITGAVVHSASEDIIPYTEIFYPSGKLRIQAYLYKPRGNGPFPLIIYNHGSRSGNEKRSVPFEHIARLLIPERYAVLVPERRGYGKSDGPISSLEIGNNKDLVVSRLQMETDDVLAALDYVHALPFVDAKRVGIIGHSYGGIVTMFAISRSDAFAVAIDQAGGALSWGGNPQLRSALMAAAKKTTTPTLLSVAQNDRTTASVTTLAEIFKQRNVPHRLVIYPPFTPERDDAWIPPGHKVFSAQGINVWGKDVLEFLRRYLGTTSTGTSTR